MAETLSSRLAPHGLVAIGSFSVAPEDVAPVLFDGSPARFATLIASAGPEMWRPFSAARRNEPDPLDRWSKRVLDPVARALGVTIAYPFDLPFHPFLRWAVRTGTIFPSPMTPSIHPVYGTWFALRAALFSAEPVVPAGPPAVNPCERCAGKPCLSVCPSGAIQHKDGTLCHAYLENQPDCDCFAHACRARRACPVGRDYAYVPDQARFHMQAFVRDFGAVMQAWRDEPGKRTAAQSPGVIL